jgi:flagellar basal body-associated protein FliL
MNKISRRTKAIVVFIVLVVAGYAIAIFWGSKNQVPVAFTNARLQGAVISQNIVEISNSSTAELAKINQDDQQRNYTDALTLTTDLINQSQQLRDQAVNLSNQIGIMTQSLSQINSFSAQQAALESISSRLALINQLINYSGDLDHLLTILQARFSGTHEPSGTVEGIVNQINTDVNAINNFNTQATQAMNQFDTIVRG